MPRYHLSNMNRKRDIPLSRPPGTLPLQGGGDVAPERDDERFKSGTLHRQRGADAQYRFRPHRSGDIGWVISRHAALYAEEYGWDITFEALVAEICAKFIKEFDASRERCWIAEEISDASSSAATLSEANLNSALTSNAQPERLGCVFVVKKDDATAQLRMLLVESRARGMKLGARLVDEAIAFARASGYKKMTLWTNDILHAARYIYEVRGFTLVKEEKHHSFGKDLVGQYWDLLL
jgi:GNAT superfamily N-acetyltransferase